MKKCYNCIYYYQSGFCGYNQSCCKIYGSLDMDQKERHPDTSAETCDKYDDNKAHIKPVSKNDSPYKKADYNKKEYQDLFPED